MSKYKIFWVYSFYRDFARTVGLVTSSSLFISPKTDFIAEKGRQLSFDDYFEGWADQGVVDFSVSLKDLNPNRKMKNTVIQEALINMININWIRLKDEKIRWV